MSHIIGAELSAELLSELGGLPSEANQTQVVDAVAAAFASVLNDAEAAGTPWTPTLQIGGSSVVGSYTHQQGLYWEIGDLVVLVCKVKISGVNASAESLRISGLPFTASSALAHWPTWLSQCSLVPGSAHARLAASTALIYINEDQRDGISTWSFASHTFFASVGAVYVAA